MSGNARRRRWLVLLVLAIAPAAAVGLPLPDLSPGDVVRIQLRALQQNDRPYRDAGIAIAFAFASPRNREQSGPLPRFVRMLHESYGEMLDHRHARLSPAVVDGDDALQPVELTARDGRVYRFVFILRRGPAPGCGRCWLTDGVLPRGEVRRRLEYAV